MTVSKYYTGCTLALQDPWWLLYLKEHYSACEQLPRKDLEPKARTVKVGVS